MLFGLRNFVLSYVVPLSIVRYLEFLSILLVLDFSIEEQFYIYLRILVRFAYTSEILLAVCTMNWQNQTFALTKMHNLRFYKTIKLQFYKMIYLFQFSGSIFWQSNKYGVFFFWIKIDHLISICNRS